MNQPIQALDNPIMLFDGVSVSDPGVAAAAAVLLLPNGRRYTVSQFLTRGTEIEAEYTGLLIGLKKARQLGIKVLEIKGDSELIFQQVNGLIAIEEPELEALCQKIQTLMRSFERISLERISPEQNRSAVAAVKRCIGEALGKEKKKPRPTPLLGRAAPDIERLIKLGTKATDQDYRALGPRTDDYTGNSLGELRELIPEAERDTIALQWDGNEAHLAEIYRWYCRGLPAFMALKKVRLDWPNTEENAEKLPWEDELQGARPSNREGAPSGPFLSSPLFEAIAETNELIFPAPVSPTPKLDRIQPIHERDTLLSFSDRPSVAEKPPKLAVSEHDPSKDTLPSLANIQELYEALNNLTNEERVLLVQQLVQESEWVNIFLQAIAERVADRR
jgi:ribonuclease HI